MICVNSLGLAETISHSCQVAPREVLTTKGGLSAATARLLAQPPIPLQLSYVEAGTEFPDAACTLQTLTEQVFHSYCLFAFFSPVLWTH